MLRQQKQEMIAKLHTTFKETSVVMMIRNNGLTVTESVELRRQVREAGSRFYIIKNRLSRIAIKNTMFENLDPFFRGPIGIVTIPQDPIDTIKIATTYAKVNPKFHIINASFGTNILDSVALQALTQLPPLDVLRAKLVELINRPGLGLVRTLQRPAVLITDLLTAPRSQQTMSNS